MHPMLNIAVRAARKAGKEYYPLPDIAGIKELGK